MSTPEKIEVAKIAASLTQVRNGTIQKFEDNFKLIMDTIESYNTTQRSTDGSGNPVDLIVKKDQPKEN